MTIVLIIVLLAFLPLLVRLAQVILALGLRVVLWGTVVGVILLPGIAVIGFLVWLGVGSHAVAVEQHDKHVVWNALWDIEAGRPVSQEAQDLWEPNSGHYRFKKAERNLIREGQVSEDGKPITTVYLERWVNGEEY